MNPDILKESGFRKGLYILWVVPLPSIAVTSRTLIVLVGDPNLNLHLPLLLGGGDNPNYTIQNKLDHTKTMEWLMLIRIMFDTTHQDQ